MQLIPKSETQRKKDRVSEVESTTSLKGILGPLRLRSEVSGQAEYYRPIKGGKSSLSSKGWLGLKGWEPVAFFLLLNLTLDARKSSY